jgi:hypothetical protein
LNAESNQTADFSPCPCDPQSFVINHASGAREPVLPAEASEGRDDG